MTRREQWILLAAVAVVAAGGFASVKLKGSASLSGNQSNVEGSAKVVNSSLRRGMANATRGDTREGAWSCPRWSMASVGVTPLRQNHPLFRRPGHIGENRHKVMSAGWGSW